MQVHTFSLSNSLENCWWWDDRDGSLTHFFPRATTRAKRPSLADWQSYTSILYTTWEMVSYDLGPDVRGIAQGKSRPLSVSWYESLSTVNIFLINIFPPPSSRPSDAKLDEPSPSMEHASWFWLQKPRDWLIYCRLNLRSSHQWLNRPIGLNIHLINSDRL